MIGLLLLALLVPQQKTATEGALTVRVLEKGTEAPLAGIRLWITRSGSSNDPLSVATETDGSVSLRLPLGQYLVQTISGTHLSGDSGQATLTVGADGPRAVTLRLDLGGVIHGRVISQGKPLGNATVWLYQLLRPLNLFDHPLVHRGQELKTDIGGSFRFTGIAPGSYMVGARAQRVPGNAWNEIYAPSAIDLRDAERIHVGRGTQSEILIDFKATPLATISGNIMESEVAGKGELLFRRLDEETGDSISYGVVPFNADGTFSTNHTGSGVHGILFRRQELGGRTLSVATAIVHVGKDDVGGVELKAVKASTLQGQFVFPGRDKKLDLAPTVYLRPDGDDRELRWGLTDGGNMEPDGKFLITGIVGRHSFSINEPDGMDR